MYKSISLFERNWNIIHVIPVSHECGGSVVILRSEDPIKGRCFSKDPNATWATSDIREYLNTDYLNQLSKRGDINIIQGVALYSRIYDISDDEWMKRGFHANREQTKNFVFIEQISSLLDWYHSFDGENPPRMLADLAVYSCVLNGDININTDTLEQGTDFIYCISDTGELSSIEKDECADVYPCIAVNVAYLPEDICPFGREGHSTCEGCCYDGEFHYDITTPNGECVPGERED